MLTLKQAVDGEQRVDQVVDRGWSQKMEAHARGVRLQQQVLSRVRHRRGGAVVARSSTTQTSQAANEPIERAAQNLPCKHNKSALLPDIWITLCTRSLARHFLRLINHVTSVESLDDILQLKIAFRTDHFANFERLLRPASVAQQNKIKLLLVTLYIGAGAQKVLPAGEVQKFIRRNVQERRAERWNS